ncbi:TauD/TfdA family dioxygenase [Sphingobium sp. HBC34]|uniref:TauD/TfdA family dioxygenase n=1 Tax=Sphingobium cyanobacteriorum TaxID=3063954 RepID=A0ABT8ZPE8_9SPHN|nr:TauD/TfdA family dioxygenase [Sphingobium sp. HBC34]MDO7836371.1 TauD/TfdA family dioxygenase [Sphingobium sp. HBC34]
MGIENIVVEPLTEHIGVELHNVVFEAMAPTRPFIDMMKRLLDEHRVVLIRGQKIEPGTAQDFTSNFGPLLDIKRQGSGALHVPDAEWIKVISNGKTADGQLIGDGNSSAQLWHTDSTPWEAPVGHIAFYCRQTVDPAPSTYFMDMIKVYEALPQAMKDRIDRLRVIHHFFPRQIEPEIHRNAPSMPLEDRKLGTLHPLVRRHLGTGKPILYLPTRRDSLIPDMDEAESRALLTELWDFVDTCPFKVGHAMMPDDYVIWDNSATVHSRDGWPAEKVRIMWHISAEGEVPIPLHPRRTLNTIGLDPDKAREVNKGMAMVDY